MYRSALHSHNLMYTYMSVRLLLNKYENALKVMVVQVRKSKTALTGLPDKHAGPEYRVFN